jgi:hypothetical protein
MPQYPPRNAQPLSSVSVTDGTTIVNPTAKLQFTGGATVTRSGPDTADVAITPGAGGINQLTGAVIAGPGTGSQAASIPAGAFGHGVVTGGVAGNLTATGIATTSKLLSVVQFLGAGTAVTGLADLTSQFSIASANTINNTGGTNTTGSQLLVTWIQ